MNTTLIPYFKDKVTVTENILDDLIIMLYELKIITKEKHGELMDLTGLYGEMCVMLLNLNAGNEE